MSPPAWLVGQLARPSGWLAPVMGRVLDRGNRAQNHAAIDALDVTAGQLVLDLGFGGGVSLRELRRRGARAVGVDPSEALVRRARRSMRDVQTVVGTAAAIPAGAGAFDRVLTVNTVYFWPDLPQGFAEVLRVLRPGGRLVVGVAEAAHCMHMGFLEHGYRAATPEAYARVIEDAGFHAVQVQRGGPAPVIVATRV